jgi:RHS repeat-associated protein
VASVTREADGLTSQIVYGDLASTTTGFTYDSRRRLKSVQTYRGPPSPWTAVPAPGNYFPAPKYGQLPATTFQLLLEDSELTYDSVDNLTEIRDFRLPGEWPEGAKPVTRQFEYDDLYRLTRTDYQYPDLPDEWVSPFQAEHQDFGVDARRAAPMPLVNFAKRPLWQTFAYDWLGNTSATDDDTKGFFDRSLGAITNNGVSGKPYQLGSATNDNGDRQRTRRGSLTANYDDAGNLVSLSVARKGVCREPSEYCNQRFEYSWDEVGRLVRARRWDLQTPQTPPGATPAADLRYGYDANDARVLKAASDGVTQVHTAYVFSSLELRRTAWVDQGGGTFDYARTKLTEVPYLTANGFSFGRVHYEEGSVDGDTPAIDANRLHVLLELGDHLGSTSTVIDRSTSELAERVAYQPYGATESDYRPLRWEGFREDYRFTGKEEDIEVGLTYFGKRFYAPLLGRWISADPLALHGPAGDPNLYAYVHGRVLSLIDPLGLQDAPPEPPTTYHESKGADGRPQLDFDWINIVGSAPARATPQPADTGPSGADVAGAIVASGGFLNYWAYEAASRPDAGVAPRELPPGGLSGEYEPGLLADPLMRTFFSVSLDVALGAAAGEALASSSVLACRPVMTGGLAVAQESGLTLAPESIILRNLGAGSAEAAQENALSRSLAAGSVEAAGGGGAATIDTALVRFSQDSVKGEFRNGTTLNEAIGALRAGGAEAAASYPPIRLFEREGMLFTLDNRRLLVFSQAGLPVPFRMATTAEVAAETAGPFSKFTTTAAQGWGRFITVRGGGGL